MADKTYLVDATGQGAYDTSYTPSPYDGPAEQGSPPSYNPGYPTQDYPTQGYPTQDQGMYSNYPAPMQTTAVDVNISVQAHSMNIEDGMPPNYIHQNIMVLVFCSLIFGIIGLVKGCSVSSLYLAGNISAAEAASLEARRWSRIGIMVGTFVKSFLIGFLIVYSI